MSMEDNKVLLELKESGCGLFTVVFVKALLRVVNVLLKGKREKYKRIVPLGDLIIDREDKARMAGFGEGTTVYDNVLIIGDVKVGENTWVGPNVILDGSGGLEIGSNCSISAGVQIYSHDSLKWAISGGKAPYEYGRTIIEENCYIGPNAIIMRGVSVGRNSIIGASSLVMEDVPPYSKAYGTPAKVAGKTIFKEDK